MKLRTLAASLALAGAVSLPASAAIITIDGISFGSGLVFETIELFEGENLSGAVTNGNGVIDQVGEELIGIGRVASIRDGLTNAVVWQNGDNGKELTIHLFDFFAEDIVVGVLPAPISSNFAAINFTGGFVNIYSQAAGTFSAVGSQSDGITSATAGNLWLSLAASPAGGFGGVSGDPVTLSSLALTAAGSDPLLSSTNVSGQALFDVTGGSAAAYFMTGTFGCEAADGAPCPDTADIKLTSSGQITEITGDQSWGFVGTGEAQSFVVPEPSVLALLGIALVGFGIGSTRRAKTHTSRDALAMS